MSKKEAEEEEKAEIESAQEEQREMKLKYSIRESFVFAFFDNLDEAIAEAESWMRSAKEVCFEYEDGFRGKYKIKIDKESFKESLEVIDEWENFKED